MLHFSLRSFSVIYPENAYPCRLLGYPSFFSSFILWKAKDSQSGLAIHSIKKSAQHLQDSQSPSASGLADSMKPRRSLQCEIDIVIESGIANPDVRPLSRFAAFLDTTESIRCYYHLQDWRLKSALSSCERIPMNASRIRVFRFRAIRT